MGREYNFSAHISSLSTGPIYNAYTIQIEGESMRKRKGIPE